MVWDREKAAAAARQYRARHREAVRERDRARDQAAHRKAARRRYQQLHGVGGGRQIGRQRLWNAFLVTLEEAMADHDAWLESIDRDMSAAIDGDMWDEYERLESSPR